MARLSRALLGRPFMPWQRVASQWLNEHDDNGTRVRGLSCVTIQRQAGKTSWLLAEAVDRCLFGAPRTRVWYTAQTASYAREKWAELVDELDRSPLRGRFRTRTANGSERLTFANGSTLRPFTPARDALHSMQSDLVIVDEAWKFPDQRGSELMQGIGPTQATRRGAQVVIVSTAGSAESSWLRGFVDRGRGGDPAVSYLEWSIPDDADPLDLDAIAKHHPAVGHTIDRAFLEREAAILAEQPGEFARAYGNRWTTVVEPVIPVGAWVSARRRDAVPADVPPVLGVDVAVDRSASSIVACWPAVDTGGLVVEVVEYRPGVQWVAKRVEELAGRHNARVVADSSGPVTTVVEELKRTRVKLTTTNTKEVSSASAAFLDRVLNGTVSHRGDVALDAAAAGAASRAVGDAWCWGRRTSGTDVSPLVAASLAVWGYTSRRPVSVPIVAYG